MSRRRIMPVTEKIAAITEKIVERSHSSRRRYLERIEKAQENAPRRSRLGCANLAHGFAACGPSDKAMLREGACSNLAIVTAYNDMLSAHQPFERFPDIIREAEAQSYHGPGTCTFYGTANSNQMLMEIMGLHLPGTTFVNPNTSLRDEITRASTRRALAITASGNDYTPIGRIVDERTIVNGVVGLLATGGSTNHTIHLVAMAAAAGIHLTWEDMAELSAIIPLLTRIYPNGKADVNHFHAAGGMGFLIRELLGAGLLHQDVKTVWGSGLEGYLLEPRLQEDGLAWAEAVKESGDEAILRGCAAPFDQTGGIAVLDGDIGRAVIK